MKSKRKVYLLGDGMIGKIHELMDYYDATTEVEIIKTAINELYEVKFLNYNAVARQRLNIPKPSLEEKAEREAEKSHLIKKAKASKEVEEGRNICKILGGEERDSYCHFTSYNFMGVVNGDNFIIETYNEKQPLAYLTTLDIDGQYSIRGDKVKKEEYEKAISTPAKSHK